MAVGLFVLVVASADLLIDSLALLLVVRRTFLICHGLTGGSTITTQISYK